MASLAKGFLRKALHQHDRHNEVTNLHDVDIRIPVHYGIPYTASVLAFDPIQRLLAIGTLDGRIKIIGGDNIEGILMAPNTSPYKYLEFLQNQGFLVAITNENDIQVWNLEFRQLCYSLKWEMNITSFAVLQGTCLMFIGDENGLVSVIKYDIDNTKLQMMPYYIPVDSVAEVGISMVDRQPVVGILPQMNYSGIRLLIAYEKGLLVLWDVSENKAITVHGSGDSEIHGSTEDDLAISEEENEICSLCWASSVSSIAAVGYINGDIHLLNLGDKPVKVVKVKISSEDRRLPVIVLHWSPASASDSEKGGYLFAYGGTAVGSEEVLTVLGLEYSSTLGSVKCVSRKDLSLNGSFANMILVPDAGATRKSPPTAIFVLTNPGQLNVYDGNLLSPQESKSDTFITAQNFPGPIPTIDPDVTVTKLCELAAGRESSNVSLKNYVDRQTTEPVLSGAKWPLTGGVPSGFSRTENQFVERIFIAGYRDGSVRIWDATSPVLKPMFVLDGKVADIDTDGRNYSVTSLAFCLKTMTIAVGDESGLVRTYELYDKNGESLFHFLNESKQEAHTVHHREGYRCSAALIASNSPVRVLLYMNSSERLAVGYENGQVAMLDLRQSSIVFLTNSGAATISPVVSLSLYATHASVGPVPSSHKPNASSVLLLPAEVLLCLTKDGCLTILDSVSGHLISSHLLYSNQSSAVSMYVTDVSQPAPLVLDLADESVPGTHDNVDAEHASDEPDSHLIICTEDVLLLFSLRSVLQGGHKHLSKVKLSKKCLWSMGLKKANDDVFGMLLLFYQTGSIELRSFQNFDIVAETSLTKILRWSYKTGMERSLSYSNGLIALVSGSEAAIISLLSTENDFRIPESLPCLHDKVLQAAAEAAVHVPLEPKRRQDELSPILRDLVKGKGFTTDESVKCGDYYLGHHYKAHLEDLFSKTPSYEQETDLEELNIDDIDIDDVIRLEYTPKPPPVHNTSTKQNIDDERKKLFEGSSDDMKPRVRTTHEILTKYKFGGDAAAAAAYARDKLVQRQEKLERISQKTAELESGAQDFASLAAELAKNMEKKKWWQI